MVIPKILQMQKEVKGLQKNADAYNYKYVSGDKILREIRPRMDALGLVLMPEVVDIVNQPVEYDTVKTVKDYKTGLTRDVTTHVVEVLTTVRMKFTWADAEDGDKLEVDWMANGCNKFDKGFGSALTYGERYYLLKLFHIATDEDDVDYVSINRDQNLEEKPVPVQQQQTPPPGGRRAPAFNRSANPFQQAPPPTIDDFIM